MSAAGRPARRLRRSVSLLVPPISVSPQVRQSVSEWMLSVGRSQSARPTLTAHRTCNGRSIIIWDTQILACRIQLAVSGVRAADCGDGMGGPQVATQTLGESEMPELKSQFKSFLGGTAASSAPPRLHGAQSQSPQISNNKSHNYGEAAVHCVPSRSHSLPSVSRSSLLPGSQTKTKERRLETAMQFGYEIF